MTLPFGAKTRRRSGDHHRPIQALSAHHSPNGRRKKHHLKPGNLLCYHSEALADLLSVEIQASKSFLNIEYSFFVS